jgi:hypothetical protein
MSDQSTRRWPVALATPLLAVVLYVASVYVIVFAQGAEWISPRTATQWGATVYAPVNWWFQNYPEQANTLSDSLLWTYERGVACRTP